MYKSVFAQDDDIPGVVRYRTYEVLKEEVANPQLRWAYLPYSMHMAGPREAIQHMILRKASLAFFSPYLVSYLFVCVCVFVCACVRAYGWEVARI
jgi:hypothetical protein